MCMLLQKHHKALSQETNTTVINSIFRAALVALQRPVAALLPFFAVMHSLRVVALAGEVLLTTGGHRAVITSRELGMHNIPLQTSRSGSILSISGVGRWLDHPGILASCHGQQYLHVECGQINHQQQHMSLSPVSSGMTVECCGRLQLLVHIVECSCTNHQCPRTHFASLRHDSPVLQ